MNLTLHIFKKDFYHLRGLFFLYLLTILAGAGLLQWELHPTEESREVGDLLQYFTLFSRFIIPYIFFGLLFLEEPLVGTTAFWLTRPISRRDLFASKLIYLALFALLPVLARVLVYSANGMSAPDLILCAAQSTLEEVYLLLFIGALAAISSSFPRMTIIVLAVIFGYFVILSLLYSLESLFATSSYVPSNYSLRCSREVVSTLILIIFAFGVIVLQYFTSRYRLAVLLGLFGLFGGAVIAELWSFDFLKRPVVSHSDPSLNPNALKMSFDGPFQHHESEQTEKGIPLEEIQATLQLTDIPDTTWIQLDRFSSQIILPNGKALPHREMNPEAAIRNYVPYAVIPNGLGLSLDQATLFNPPPTQKYQFNLMALRQDTYFATATTPLNCTIKTHGVVRRYQRTSEVALQEGAHWRQGSNQLTLKRFLHQPESLELFLQLRRADLQLAPGREQPSFYEKQVSWTTYVLWNKNQHQALVQNPNEQMTNESSSGTTFVADKRRLTFPLNPLITQAWLDGAVLERLDLVPVGEFDKTVIIPGFRLDGNFSMSPQ